MNKNFTSSIKNQKTNLILFLFFLITSSFAQSLFIKEGDKLILTRGKSINLTTHNPGNRVLKWSSSDTNLATVDQNGKVHVLKTGKVTIDVRTVGGKSFRDSAEITITLPYLNRISTPGFEITTDFSWQYNNIYQQGIEQRVPFEGDYTPCIRASQRSSLEKGLSLEPNTTYRFSFWGKVSNGGEYAYVRISQIERIFQNGIVNFEITPIKRVRFTSKEFERTVFEFTTNGKPTDDGSYFLKVSSDDPNNGLYCIDNLEIYKKNALSNPAIGSVIWLKAINGKYVSVNENQNQLKANADVITNREKFLVVEADGGFVALKSLSNNRYVSVSDTPNGDLKANAKGIFNRQKFKWINQYFFSVFPGAIPKITFQSKVNENCLDVNDTTGQLEASIPCNQFISHPLFTWERATSSNKYIESEELVLASNNTKTKVIAYPMPAVNSLTIKGLNSDLGDTKVLVSTLSGETVKETRTSDSSLTLDVTDLEGMYLLSLNNKEGMYHSSRILVE